jgi:hypothetical protein
VGTVASEELTYLEGHEKRHGLNRVITAVDVVAHEEVVGVRDFAANLEQFH